MQVISAESTELFSGPPDAPVQLARVTLDGVTSRVTVRVDGDGLSGSATVAGGRGRRRGAGDRAAAGDGATPRGARTCRWTHVTSFVFTVAEPGWTMFMVNHFHYDPVWWNTQGAYTSVWTEDPPGRCRQTHAFDLVSMHLDTGAQRTGIQVRAGRGRLPQAVLGHPPRRPGRPAAAHRRRPGRDHGRHLQRTQHQPGQPGDHDPNSGTRLRFSA